MIEISKKNKEKSELPHNHIKIIIKYKPFKNNSNFIYSSIKCSIQDGQIKYQYDYMLKVVPQWSNIIYLTKKCIKY